MAQTSAWQPQSPEFDPWYEKKKKEKLNFLHAHTQTSQLRMKPYHLKK